MAIKITIGNKGPSAEEKKREELKFDSEIRRTLDGNLMILDHEDIDIVLMPEKMKVLTYAKGIMDDKVYATQNRMMKYLIKKGIIEPSSVHSGNVYGSIEGKILPSSDNLNSSDLTLLNVQKWLEEEKPHFMYLKQMKEKEQEELTDPSQEDSTELGEVPAAEKKGTVKSFPYRIYNENKNKS